MKEQNDEMKRMESRTWYDDFCMWAGVIVALAGGAALIGGAVASIATSIKDAKAKKAAPATKGTTSHIKPNTIPFYVACNNMLNQSK
jgi:hypothetical protein